MEYHGIANIFPMMQPNELEKLAEDIKTTGLQNKIILYEGKILDGRNRYEACNLAGIGPEYGEYEGNEPLAYVISLNLHRRHLSESQRAVVASRLANMTHGGDRKSDQAANLPDDISQPQAAEMLNVSERMIRSVKAIEKAAPDLVKDIESGKITVNKAEREVRARTDKAELAEAQASVSAEARESIESVCDLRLCSCAELFASGIKPDAVITDPPYPKEYLHLFNGLAESCANAGVPLVAVMSGQTYLPDVLQMLCRHLKYRWTIAYLTPGGQSVQQFPVKVNCFWKPVFLFGEATGWVGDVSRSATNDNDKRFHGWGQSESGMADLVERLTKPGQLVCDPFLGGGTTAVVSLALGRRFIGCDIDADCVANTRQRVESSVC